MLFTDKQLDVLTRLADFLENKIEDSQFDIEYYRNEDFISESNCGTVGCALGWMPFVEKTIKSDYDNKLDFDRYSIRVLGADFSFLGNQKQKALAYLFEQYNSLLEGHDTRLSAVKRIRTLVKANEYTDEIREHVEKLLTL